MKKQNKKPIINRRKFLPLLSVGFILPFFKKQDQAIEKDEYETLLTPEGETVKVRKKAVENATVIKNSLSNKSFLKWLKKKM